MIKVYIASPYRLGNAATNVKVQIDCADRLMNEGFSPYTPLLTHFQALVHPRTDEYDWLRLDLDWLQSCNCVLRLPGESEGADIEVKTAESKGLKVFYSIEDVIQFYTYKDIVNYFLDRMKISIDESFGPIFSIELDLLKEIEAHKKIEFGHLWDSLSDGVKDIFIQDKLK